MSPRQPKIVVLDDDPTGSQTVHSCWLLTQWGVEDLREAMLDDGSPLFFVLTNTRGMTPSEATKVTREVCHNLKIVLEQETSLLKPILVSRSDSTLRGHYPVETNVIHEELGPFDAQFLVPAFFQGGRVTIDSTHYLFVEGKLTPCHETEFAKDSVFGYSTAYMPEYVQEKTKGLIKADQVERIILKDIREDDSIILENRISKFQDNVCGVVDGEKQSDLDTFADTLLKVAAEHQRAYLFRSAASLLTALAKLPPCPVSMEEMGTYALSGADGEPLPGVILVGSHVPMTTKQLHNVLREPNVVGVEVNVSEYDRSKDYDCVLEALTKHIRDVLVTQRKHLVLYTSRVERQFVEGHDARLAFGKDVSDLLMDLIQSIPERSIGFLVSKGGITSNDVLSHGLRLKKSKVVGQILVGCSVVTCPIDHSRHPKLPVVIFPGNVGDEYGLVTALRRMTGSN